MELENLSFTKENFDKLKETCANIIIVSEDNVNGDLMLSQLLFLGELIADFINNPIVKNSGIK